MLSRAPLPSIQPRPKPKRRLMEKTVTVAAGFCCYDGIVMCADSQESAGDYKFPVQKLVAKRSSFSDAIIAGSGVGPLVDMATERIHRAIWGGCRDYETAELVIGNVLNGLYEKEFRLYPASDQDDTFIELLIAYKIADRAPILFHSAATAIRVVQEYAIIGSGRAVQYQVQNLYERQTIHESGTTISRGILLAVQLLSVAKSVLSSVGGAGKIATLHADKGIGEAVGWQVADAERALRQMDTQAGKVLLDLRS